MTEQGDELTPVERRAFAQLPLEQQPPVELEDRVVALLRRAGHLPTPIRGMGGSGYRGTGNRVWWLSGAVAAALAVFASGVAVGQYVGARSAAELVSASHGRDAAAIAASMQRAGSLYVTALASLSQLGDSAPGTVRDSVRMVAKRILGEAAQEMVLLAPDDPLAAAVLRGLNQRSRDEVPTVPSRSVVWY